MEEVQERTGRGDAVLHNTSIDPAKRWFFPTAALSFVAGAAVTTAAHLYLSGPWHSLWSGVATVGVLALPFAFRMNTLSQASSISAVLGSVAATGFIGAYTFPEHKALGVFVGMLAGFHQSEYLVTSRYNSATLSFDSFLLNHSVPYGIAMTTALLEYGLRACFFPQHTSYDPVFFTGLALVVLGDVFRKVAMITAATNFNHIVARRRKVDHQLVTHGIYGLVRHPSYAGWFWWSVGTQVMLGNPFSTFAFALASYKFFKDRLEEEEFYLTRFFWRAYIEYKERVWSGVPFIP